MVHFGQLDTETDLGHGFVAPDEPGGAEGEDASPVNATLDAQTNWLEADLAAQRDHMTHEFVTSKNRSVLDSATLYKARTCAAAAVTGTNSTSGNGQRHYQWHDDGLGGDLGSRACGYAGHHPRVYSSLREAGSTRNRSWTADQDLPWHESSRRTGK
ncbi:hypothetical protein VTK73DRAFT_453 [Phialemonium thermophilum]|uniref:Uncharacterized protein n=1 Tax=Phialemonium thermophilum TaxID=223376 RepID=A0ABR3VV22_9PEZI